MSHHIEDESSIAAFKPHANPARQPRSPWPLVWLLYLAGLMAAAQIGKMSALAPLVGSALGLDLTAVGAAISMIEIGGATLGAAAGLFAHRLGLRLTVRASVAVLALGGLGCAFAQGAPGLIGWRLLEAAGYLGVIVSAPVLIVNLASTAGVRTQAVAMTLWSTFVPVGLALGAWANATAAAAWGWRATMAVGGLIGISLSALLWWSRLPDFQRAPQRQAVAGLTPELWCLAIGFGLFALFEVGVLGLLPMLLVREAGLGTQAAGQWTAVAAVAAVAGSAATAWLLRRGYNLRWPVLFSLAVPALLLFGVFTPAPSARVAIGLAILLNMIGGVFASAAFALLPKLACKPEQMVRANSLLAQFGASGSLLGPPAMAACVQWGGWPLAAALGLAASLLAAPLAWHAATAYSSR